jgi:hypothetical protein
MKSPGLLHIYVRPVVANQPILTALPRVLEERPENPHRLNNRLQEGWSRRRRLEYHRGWPQTKGTAGILRIIRKYGASMTDKTLRLTQLTAASG